MKNLKKYNSLSTVILFACIVLSLVIFFKAFIKPSNETKRFNQYVIGGIGIEA